MSYGEKMTCLPPQMNWGKDNEHSAIKCYLESRHKNGEAISLSQLAYIYVLFEGVFRW